MSGIDLPDGQQIRKGAPDSMLRYVRSLNGIVPDNAESTVAGVASKGATPLLVSDGNRIAGMVVLEDILKPGIAERFERLRRMGLRTVMVTGDNPLTAKAIAEQAGVDDYIAEATPEAKLAYIRKEQQGGKLVAMMGDGTNDAPALAQADVGVAMNSGTQAAKEAGNMVDLDSDPDEADRDRRDRQAVAHDPRFADHVFHRQRPGQVLCHRAGLVRRHAALAQAAGHHAPALGHLGDPLGRDFQRDHHPAVDPHRLEGRQVSTHRGRRPACAATCWCGASAA